jgi:dihydroxyacetone kinase-like protein
MSGDALAVGQLVEWLSRFRDAVVDQQAYLTELDSAIGDADHGTNMARGMTAVMAKVDAEPPTTADALLKGAGMTLVSSVGGASGPLYGTLLLRLGMGCGGSDTVDATTFAQALRAGLEGVVARGKAQPGDKTMIDALTPALAAFEQALEGDGSLADAAVAAATAAEEGRDATYPLVARKGRASYLGDRSAGHLDPGATSTAMLFRALADTVADPLG